MPVLGLIFLRYADHKFAIAEKELAGKGSGRRAIGKEDYQAKGVMYLPPDARYHQLLTCPKANIGKAIKEAMKAIEAENEVLKGTFPRRIPEDRELLPQDPPETFAEFEVDAEGDKFGKMYEYFLGNFARAEGQKGGEFFTPESLVKLIVEIIEPYHGKIFDPACGSGGMFVHSGNFVKRTRRNPTRKSPSMGRSGWTRPASSVSMNLAVHGLSFGKETSGKATATTKTCTRRSGQVRLRDGKSSVQRGQGGQGEDQGRPRFPLGMPKVDNANYLWISTVLLVVERQGAGGVRHGELGGGCPRVGAGDPQEVAPKHAVDVMVSIGPNFFYTVTLPCTLWFLDRGKATTPRKDKVLFVDARHIRASAH